MTPVDSKLIRRWERAETHLRAAIPELQLTDLQGPLIADFMDHNELGLAFEWIVEALATSQTEIPKKAFRHLSGAAAELGLRDNRNWKYLLARA